MNYLQNPGRFSQTGAAEFALQFSRLVALVKARAYALEYEPFGVYLYEVAEGLGNWLRTQELVSQADAEAQLIKLASEFYRRDCTSLVCPVVSESTEQDSSSQELHEYAFDVKLQAVIRVKATSAESAKELLHNTFDAASCNGGAWPNGDPVLYEASTAEGYEPELFEIDGKELANT